MNSDMKAVAGKIKLWYGLMGGGNMRCKGQCRVKTWGNDSLDQDSDNGSIYKEVGIILTYGLLGFKVSI